MHVPMFERHVLKSEIKFVSLGLRHFQSKSTVRGGANIVSPSSNLQIRSFNMDSQQFQKVRAVFEKPPKAEEEGHVAKMKKKFEKPAASKKKVGPKTLPKPKKGKAQASESVRGRKA